ncbi:MAG: COX aromatic rich motif-containing protein [Chlamydiales bacterium]
MLRKRIIFSIIALAVVAAFIAIFFVLSSENALVTHPKGVVAHGQLKLIITNILLMLIIIVPTYIFLFAAIQRSRAKNNAKADAPRKPQQRSLEFIPWIIPAVIVLVMALVTWKATHELDPYKPLESEVTPLTIQVVALDWKWLFIYPEQGIATLNFVQFPARTPIHLKLTADGSPMNSFWLPELSGQIYAMTGMATTLHIMADQPGVYRGRAAEINGKGLADMTFVAKSTSQSDFDAWIHEVKQAPQQLTDQTYKALVTPSLNLPVTLYSYVENNLFDKIVMQYMHPASEHHE